MSRLATLILILSATAASAVEAPKRYDVGNRPHHDATAGNAVVCAAVWQFMAESRIAVAPPESGAFFGAAAPALPAAAGRLDPAMTVERFEDGAETIRQKIASEYGKSRGNAQQEAAFQTALDNQYFGCIGMIDDLVGKGLLQTN